MTDDTRPADLVDELRKSAALNATRPEWTKRKMPTITGAVSGGGETRPDAAEVERIANQLGAQNRPEFESYNGHVLPPTIVPAGDADDATMTTFMAADGHYSVRSLTWREVTERVLAAAGVRPVPLTEHRMVPGSHERAAGAECVCGGAWSRWDDTCASVVPLTTKES